jgi:8-oxo-dGTP diphosphatase
MLLAGLWEFPGGKVESRESPQSALVREIGEELGLTIDVGPWIGRGESTVEGEEIVLDVFCSRLVQGQPHPKEHAQTRWIDAREIGKLEWAEADRPILPLLRRALERGLTDRALAKPIPLVSVDWGKKTEKRAVFTATPRDGGWCVERPTPPADGWHLEEVLNLTESLAEPFDGSALVVIDAVLGVPVTYGLRTGRESFPEAMGWLDRQGALAQSVREPKDWRPESPFFAVKAGAGGLTRYAERAGGRSVLYRQCERVTGGNPVFATSGIPGSVGSGSAALWREILAARRSGGHEFRLWPFEVELDEVPSSGALVIAESYPRACYAVALASDLPSEPISLAKTRRDERRTRLKALLDAPWVQERDVKLGGLDWAEVGEDDFDALMQAAALARMLDSGIPLSSHLVDPTWEGGILGTGGLLLREPSVPRTRLRRARRSRSSRRRGESEPLKRCPIEGCQKVFLSGRSGWDSHVASASLHPDWEPALVSSADRKSAFRAQFSDWFEKR